MLMGLPHRALHANRSDSLGALPGAASSTRVPGKRSDPSLVMPETGRVQAVDREKASLR